MAQAEAQAQADVSGEEAALVSAGRASIPAPGESVSLTQAADDEPLVRTLSRIPGLDEARTAAMLSDPNIVAVYDFEIQDSTAYLIMEYVEGMTLTELLRDHDAELTLDIVAAVFDGVAHALEVAHENGVLHLDIKPDNILINHAGQVKVTDFGLATLADASGFGPAGGGTIGYMPLEQMRQENLDARCDEWALASVTYEMLAGTAAMAGGLALAVASLSAQAPWTPSAFDIASLAVSAAIMLFASYLLPDPEYYDEGDE